MNKLDSICAVFNEFIPYAGVTSTDKFLGVNRSFDILHFAGHYLNRIGGNFEEVLSRASAFVATNGGNIDTFVTHNGTNWRSIMTPGGLVAITQSGCVPQGSIYGINMKSWKETDKPYVVLGPGQAITTCCNPNYKWEQYSATFIPTELGYVCTKPINNINIRML